MLTICSMISKSIINIKYSTLDCDIHFLDCQGSHSYSNCSINKGTVIYLGVNLLVFLRIFIIYFELEFQPMCQIP